MTEGFSGYPQVPGDLSSFTGRKLSKRSWKNIKRGCDMPYFSDSSSIVGFCFFFSRTSCTSCTPFSATFCSSAVTLCLVREISSGTASSFRSTSASTMPVRSALQAAWRIFQEDLSVESHQRSSVAGISSGGSSLDACFEPGLEPVSSLDPLFEPGAADSLDPLFAATSSLVDPLLTRPGSSLDPLFADTSSLDPLFKRPASSLDPLFATSSLDPLLARPGSSLEPFLVGLASLGSSFDPFPCLFPAFCLLSFAAFSSSASAFSTSSVWCWTLLRKSRRPSSSASKPPRFSFSERVSSPSKFINSANRRTWGPCGATWDAYSGSVGFKNSPVRVLPSRMLLSASS
mmetsp:Transcript_37517/g.76701  ORF Transcript_37517/g.76701 Transcript_37517/m.76701 type:complete len:345 (-) Transcript_37517:982-2016(-)